MSAILPGATLGVLGSGQLGRMFAIAARRMPYSTLGFFQFLAPSIVFVLGLTVFEQPLEPMQAACFACIWIAAAIFIWDLLRRQRAAS